MKNVAAFAVLTVTLIIVLPFTGCSGETKPKTDSADSTNTSAATTVDDHSGWWCPEHGVPEETCSMCSSKAAADFKAKDDWCEEHNRAESQCFICEPSRAAKFASLYEAKFGKKPPQMNE